MGIVVPNLGDMAPIIDDGHAGTYYTTTQRPEASKRSEVENELEDAVDDSEINKWGECIRHELQTHTARSEDKHVMNIPRVPDRLRRDSEAPYDPRIISIGPYHHNKCNLKPMEKHKWEYLKAILSRNPNFRLEDYIRKIKAVERTARKCYSGEFYLESKMFVQAMLLDGCFIVEYLLRNNADERSNLGGMIWKDGLLLHDLLLLENQLPFFILQEIFNLAKKKAASSLDQVVMNFFNKMFFTKKTGLPSEPKFHHLLHFYYCILLMPIPVASNTPPSSLFKDFISKCMGLGKQEEHSTAATTETETKISMIPNATALEKAGIKLKKRKLDVEGGDILDVKFNRGIMEIPPLHINASTKTQFRNLIAFEQFHPHTEAKFTAYIIFLDNIVNTAEDVALLHRNGIIEHMLGSDTDVAVLFNELIRGTFTRSNNYLSELYKNVDTHYRTKKHRWWASVVQTYLNSPLKILSMWAGITLLVLTFLQTFFSVFSYFRPPSF